MSSIYYHNPRCSKSREGLKILEDAGASFTIKEYLKEPLSKTEIKGLFKKLNRKPLEVVRTKEQTFKDLNLKGKQLSNDEWAQIIVDNPVLLERPIFTKGENAVVGRPPEDIRQLI